MQYYRCECGRKEMWGSLNPVKCEGCGECNTTLAQRPEDHRKPELHDPETKYDQNSGKPYLICKTCSKRL